MKPPHLLLNDMHECEGHCLSRVNHAANVFRLGATRAKAVGFCRSYYHNQLPRQFIWTLRRSIQQDYQ